MNSWAIAWVSWEKFVTEIDYWIDHFSMRAVRLLNEQTRMSPFKRICGCMSLRVACLCIGVLGCLDSFILIDLEFSTLSVISVICSAILIYGAVKMERRYLLPYLYLRFFLAFATIGALGLFLIVIPVFEYPMYRIKIIVRLIVFAIVEFLWFWIVFSFHVELQSDDVGNISDSNLQEVWSSESN